jgi:hypothetical protein
VGVELGRYAPNDLQLRAVDWTTAAFEMPRCPHLGTPLGGVFAELPDHTESAYLAGPPTG